MSFARTESASLPEDLRNTPRGSLEEYVTARIKQFSRVFARQLVPGATEQSIEYAYARTQQALGSSPEARAQEGYILRFKHKCRFLGCARKECQLCKNNPSKHCSDDDNFDECYADNQVLKSKCEADVYLELVNSATGNVEALPGVELVVSVVDGESYHESSQGSSVKELLKNDDGNTLLGSYLAGSKTDAEGRLYLKVQEGSIRLPDVCITDKNDTFHMGNETYGSFRLMAKAVQRDLYGNAVLIDGIIPAVSGKFIVKTQRALNDYRKADYPHYKDELTKLKHIGSITAQRLREIQQHLDCPYTCIETVEQLKHLMQYADQNRQVENKLLELLNMKGKHKHKWDFLREVLSERVVYDDTAPRAWFVDDNKTLGVLFSCKQAQLNLDRPLGLLQRVNNGNQSRLVVTNTGNLDAQQAETLKSWRAAAEQYWYQPNHQGWSVVTEPLEMINMAGGASIVIAGGNSAPSHMMVGADGGQPSKSRRSSTTYPGSPELTSNSMAAMYSMQGGHMKTEPGGPFQFGGMSNMITSGSGLTPNAESFLEVYRTASAPNMAVDLTRSVSGPPIGMYQHASGEIHSESNILPPPPMRTSRHRRLSADATAARAASLGQGGPLSPDSYGQDSMADHGKRTRGPIPTAQLIEDVVVQEEGNFNSSTNPRHMLYHFESRGRHTPRSRLSSDVGHEMTSPGGVMGAMGVMSPAEMENYLATNFAYLAGGNAGEGLRSAEHSGSLLGNPGGLHTDNLTGQMQHRLILNDASLDHNALDASGMADLSGFTGMEGRTLFHSDSSNMVSSSRALKHCESDSFKRFLAAGLPFSPMDATPEGYDSGLPDGVHLS